MNKTEIPGLDELIGRALDEDIGTCDITTAATVPEDAVIEGSHGQEEPEEAADKDAE